MIKDLQQHHIGCLVENIEEFREENKATWNISDYSEIYKVSTQDVRVCFLQLTSDTCVELVEPGAANKPLSGMLAKGTTYYHIGFISASYDDAVGTLNSQGFRQLAEFKSEAFEGRRCTFFYHPQLRLIELIEG